MNTNKKIILLLVGISIFFDTSYSFGQRAVIPQNTVIAPSHAPIASSPNKMFHLYFQGDGNIVLRISPFPNELGIPYWNSKSDKTTPEKLVMQGDGNFVYYGKWGLKNPFKFKQFKRSGAIWNTNTHGNPGAWIQIQDDGNLVIYSKDSRPLWATNTVYNNVVRWNQLSSAQKAEFKSRVREEIRRRTPAEKQSEALDYANQKIAYLENTNAAVTVPIPGGTAETIIIIAALHLVGLDDEVKDLLDALKDALDDIVGSVGDVLGW